MKTSFYPNDQKVRDWIAVAMVVSEATWKHIEEWKKNYVGSAVPEVARRTEATTRGIQQASFLFLDISKKDELDADDLMNAVTVFYLAASHVVAFLEGHNKGDWEPEGLKATAENLLEYADKWYNDLSNGRKAVGEG